MEGSVDQEVGDGNTGANVMPTGGQATIDAPQFNAAHTELELEKRSVKDVNQAWNMCKTLEQNNRSRAARTADIQAIHDGEPPRNSGAQLEKAKSWQANASTMWLSGITGRQAQRFVNAIISQPFLSFSRLPDKITYWKEKSDLMQAKITQLIRSWQGHTTFINSIAVENVLQGYTYAVFIDPYTNKPKMYKQDRLFMPEESRQHASEIQFFCTKEDYRLDEFLALITGDAEVDSAAGYNLENCENAAANATMKDPREDATTTQFRKYVDMVNEGTLGLSYTSTGERVVKVWLMFNKEYDGKVSMWMIDRDSGKQLRFSFKLFAKMDDVLTIFSFEPGNGCIHSSKGLGRKLAALAIMKELFRCGIIDNARISSLLMLQCDSKERNRLAPQILSPFIYLDKSLEPSQIQFTPKADALQKIDELIDQWAEQAVGAYLISQAQDATAPEKTATQATIEAKREKESADIGIRRFLDQWFNMVQIQQLRSYSDENIKEARRIFEEIVEDPDKETPEIYEVDEYDPATLQNLVEIMSFSDLAISDDEIKVWRRSPASVFAHVSDAIIQQGIEAVYAQFKGDPNIDQSKLIAKVVEGRVGARDAADLIIPKPDETIAAEAAQQQLTEACVMTKMFQVVPVSPRNNHLAHGMVVMTLLNKLGPLLSKPNPPPELLKEFELLINHLGSHLEFANAQQLQKDPRFGVLEKFFKSISQQIAQVIQINTAATVAQHAVTQKIAAEGFPPPATAPVAAPAAPAAVPNAGATEAEPALATAA